MSGKTKENDGTAQVDSQNSPELSLRHHFFHPSSDAMITFHSATKCLSKAMDHFLTYRPELFLLNFEIQIIIGVICIDVF